MGVLESPMGYQEVFRREKSEQHLATLLLAEQGAYYADRVYVESFGAHFGQPLSLVPPGFVAADYCFHKQPRTAIPHRQPRRVDVCGLSCAPRTPRTRALCQLLVVATLVLVLVQALSCGLLFCVALPRGRASYIDLREVFTEFRLFNSPQNPGPVVMVKPQSGAPGLIPRILHQTYRNDQIPDALREVRKSLRLANHDSWQIRFYDDADCIAFVEREFPEYLDAYRALPKDVERSDFFRYMVVLRLGGAYADIDVELRKPLDEVIRPTDTMVVGWEAEVSTDAQAFHRHFVRKRQVLQWFFAAAPGHPVLRAICDHIAQNANHSFSNNTNRDTLERTGPGAWTDAVLRHAALHPPALANDPWKVRILPRVAFGVHPSGTDGLTQDAPEIVALHHFWGSWKDKAGWKRHRTVLQVLIHAAQSALSRRSQAAEEPIPGSPTALFPVEVSFNPPFHIMTNLVGHGDRQAGSDVSAVLTSWGVWQAALRHPTRRPLAVEALVGQLSACPSCPVGGPTEAAAGGTAAAGAGLVLVDVSAGLGYFSLAAAARGHQVMSFETSRPSIEAFTASIQYNGFQDRIRLYNVSLGAEPGTVCLAAAHAPGGPADADALGGVAAAEASNAVVADMASATRRGYGDPALHSLPPSKCGAMAERQTLSNMIMANKDFNSSGGVPLAQRVGALRLSAHGWEGWILDGAQPWIQNHPPGVVLLEFAPKLIERSNYSGGGLRVLEQLHRLGYVPLAHAGYVCEERWYNISRAVRAGSAALGPFPDSASSAPCCSEEQQQATGLGLGAGAAAAAAAEAAKPSAWCKLKRELFQMLVDKAHPEIPENVLFVYKDHPILNGEGGAKHAAGPAQQSQAERAAQEPQQQRQQQQRKSASEAATASARETAAGGSSSSSSTGAGAAAGAAGAAAGLRQGSAAAAANAAAA